MMMGRTIHEESLDDTIRSNGLYRPRLQQQYWIQIQFPECQYVEDNRSKNRMMMMIMIMIMMMIGDGGGLISSFYFFDV